MLLDPLTDFKIQKYHQNEAKFNSVYSRNNLPKIKDRPYIISLDEYEPIGTHWIAMYVNDENVIFGVGHIWKEIKEYIGNKNIITNIDTIQAYDSIICRYFCVGAIDFMFKSKSLIDYKNFFSPNDYEMNEKIILKYFQ